MSANNILAIDAGNTRIKWGLFNSSGIMVEQGACLHAELATVTFPDALNIVISNVAGEAIRAQLSSLLPKIATIHWVRATRKACGVSNHYRQPETLGCDRWAALIAAWHIKQATCVVVNAGTAVTIDALSVSLQGEDEKHDSKQADFIGGLILPGLDLMQQSLGIATAQLPKEPLKSHSITEIHPVEIFATNTADAIYAGALHAILGAIDLMLKQLEQQSKQTPYILISGGNASIIYNQMVKENLIDDMATQAVIVDNLVLQGLYLIGNSMQSESQ
jgi:type III pantothenate kinase